MVADDASAGYNPTQSHALPGPFAIVADTVAPGATVVALRVTVGTAIIVIVALVAPLLGAIADFAAMKKKMLGTFVWIGVVATTAMYWIRAGDWKLALVLFILGNIAREGLSRRSIRK